VHRATVFTSVYLLINEGYRRIAHNRFSSRVVVLFSFNESNCVELDFRFRCIRLPFWIPVYNTARISSSRSYNWITSLSSSEEQIPETQLRLYIGVHFVLICAPPPLKNHSPRGIFNGQHRLKLMWLPHAVYKRSSHTQYASHPSSARTRHPALIFLSYSEVYVGSTRCFTQTTLISLSRRPVVQHT